MLGSPSGGSRQFRVAARAGTVAVGGTDRIERERLTVDAVNASASFKGDEKSGPFNVPGDLAREWLRLPANPNGRTNADVLKPWINGMDVTRRSADKWIVVWCDVRICPDKQLIVIVRDDDTTFSIVHSRFHEVWSLRLGTSLEDRPRYTPSTTTFKTFPFPPGLTPDIPCQRVCLRPACCGCNPGSSAAGRAARPLARPTGVGRVGRRAGSRFTRSGRFPATRIRRRRSRSAR